MATSNELDALLADLQRQRADLDQRIAEVTARREGSSDLVERLQRLRERSERTAAARIGADDDTVRMRR